MTCCLKPVRVWLDWVFFTFAKLLRALWGQMSQRVSQSASQSVRQSVSHSVDRGYKLPVKAKYYSNNKIIEKICQIKKKIIKLISYNLTALQETYARREGHRNQSGRE